MTKPTKTGGVNMLIGEMQKEIDKWAEANGGYWQPLSQMARLTEETGEVARVLNHMYGEKKKNPDEMHKSLEEELGDVLFTIICIANSQKLSLKSAYETVIKKYNVRDKDRWNK
jgi:NTP pyrophosphatase (non-canonical NTP hydrolase)